MVVIVNRILWAKALLFVTFAAASLATNPAKAVSMSVLALLLALAAELPPSDIRGGRR